MVWTVLGPGVLGLGKGYRASGGEVKKAPAWAGDFLRNWCVRGAFGGRFQPCKTVGGPGGLAGVTGRCPGSEPPGEEVSHRLGWYSPHTGGEMNITAS